jgi:hypothetical protein
MNEANCPICGADAKKSLRPAISMASIARRMGSLKSQAHDVDASMECEPKLIGEVVSRLFDLAGAVRRSSPWTGIKRDWVQTCVSGPTQSDSQSDSSIGS